MDSPREISMEIGLEWPTELVRDSPREFAMALEKEM